MYVHPVRLRDLSDLCSGLNAGALRYPKNPTAQLFGGGESDAGSLEARLSQLKSFECCSIDPYTYIFVLVPSQSRILITNEKRATYASGRVRGDRAGTCAFAICVLFVKSFTLLSCPSWPMRLSSHLRPYPRRPLYKSRPLSNLASTTVTAPRFPSPSLSRLRQHTGIATSAFTRHSQMFASTRTLTLEAQDLSKSPAMSGPSPKVTLEEDAKLWKFVSAAGNVPAHHIYDAPIQKSESDDREYRIIRLDNGLEALLVHDSTTDKSAASMDVAVGHLSDPVSLLRERTCPIV